MAARTEVLSQETPFWTLKLRTSADPMFQLRKLQELAAAGRGLAGTLPELWAEAEFRLQGCKTETWKFPPSIFENTIYNLSVQSKPGWEVLRVRHPLLRDIEDSLDCDSIGGIAVWRGTLRTGNDIGWFSLEIESKPLSGGKSRVDRIGWQVWPLKLDYESDLRQISSAINKEYPFWLFKFQTQTMQNAGRSSGRQDPFLLMWYQQFSKVWQELDAGLRIVRQNPYVRLQGQEARRRADSLMKRISPKLEEQIAAGRQDYSRRYQVKEWRSSCDTAENQFVAEVLEQLVRGLDQFKSAITSQPDSTRISEAFLSQLDAWRRGAAVHRADALFRGLSPFAGMSQESLVLHHRAGYSAVYRSWLQLRQHLELFSRSVSNRIGMRSISELYEIWCFLELRRLIIDLDFEEVETRTPQLKNRGLERELVNGSGAAFQFIRSDGLRVRLAHEPVYSRSENKGIYRSFTVTQRPDIVLEAEWPQTEESAGQKLLWVFDAKYRVKTEYSSPQDDRDEGRNAEYLVPPDALDQMHRYRDSIMSFIGIDKSRPVISAFALYPGIFDQSLPASTNPYADAIVKAGIGAFPLVPGANGGLWLKDFLTKTFGKSDAAEYRVSQQILRDPSVRIPVTGLEYPADDVLIVFLDSKRSTEYLKQFRTGTAKGYHIYQQTGPAGDRLSKVNYLAVINPAPVSGGPRELKGVFFICNRYVKKRSELGLIETGVVNSSRHDSDCYWFELSHYWELPQALEVGKVEGKWFRYASLQSLFTAKNFLELNVFRENMS